MHTPSDLAHIAAAAKTATFEMSTATTEQKNNVLKSLIRHLKESREHILQVNAKEIAQAKAQGLSEPLLERLSLGNRLDGILHDIEQVIALPDPIGEVYDETILPNKLRLEKHRTPIGVLGVIYESRPNVTIDITILAIKSGNCAVLRGGSETLLTNQVLLECIKKSLISAELPAEAVQLITNPDRALVKQLLQLHESIDLIIPRGSETLQKFCRENSTIPVITGGVGICHLFVDASADQESSLKVIFNAKTQRPTVCNALDTLLVHSDIAGEFIPKVIQMLGEKGVTFRLDPGAEKLTKSPLCQAAGPNDWDTEWLSLVLGIKIVPGLKQAMEHIRLHSTGHSDGILTEDQANAGKFVNGIDSAAVYVNASTRFTDGSQFGMGAEVAISTQKLHARGPMGLHELTSYKWVVHGDYQVRT